jgi:hypothetical protein
VDGRRPSLFSGACEDNPDSHTMKLSGLDQEVVRIGSSPWLSSFFATLKVFDPEPWHPSPGKLPWGATLAGTKPETWLLC